jgi:hypothetical protein
MQKMVFIPIGGLANRILAVSAAIRFCEDNDIRLKIVWFKDWGMGADFHELFRVATQYNSVQIKDARWYDYIFDRPRRRNLWLPTVSQVIMFDAVYNFEKDFNKTDFLEWYKSNANKKKYYVVHCQEFYSKNSNYSILQPTENILKEIEQQRQRLNENTVGIHIRRTDHTSAIDESPTSLFEEKIRQLIEIEPTTNFYLATDSVEEKQYFQTTFGKRIITRDIVLNRGSADGIKAALVELYTLAATRKILGSSGSTFSALAAKIGGIPIEILKKR